MFLGNQYVRTFSLAKIGKGVGLAGGVVGLALDGVGVYNYYHPTAENINSRVSSGKFGSDAGMTGVGIWGGEPGIAISLLYFGIDALYPGGVQAASNDYVNMRMRYDGGTAGMTATMNGLQ